MISLTVSGARGRMGSRILSLAFSDNTFNVVGALEREGHPDLGKDIGQLLGLGARKVLLSSDAAKALQASDVLIEFSSPEATLSHLALAAPFKKAVVIGTTGLTMEAMKEVQAASRNMPVLISPNMSVGVNLLFELVSDAARRLPDYEVEIVETHHRHKKDAP
ncbi:MAG: 4-hydroxy-tetrahydrodipicolinate reductase, partial [Candidatus Omnitrophota bacterium]